MCGIVYSKNFFGRDVTPTIEKRFYDQKERGMDGFGFYLPKTNQLTHNTKAGRTMTLLKRTAASEVLFHHRFPTSTPNTRRSCHPFSTGTFFKKNYVLVHNGNIKNSDELKRRHEQLGISYVSETADGKYNDSESLLWDLALYFEGKIETVEAQGAIAFILIQRDKNGEPEMVHFARNAERPLVFKLRKTSITISSEGEGDIVLPQKLYSFNYRTKVMEESAFFLRGGFSYSPPPVTRDTHLETPPLLISPPLANQKSKATYTVPTYRYGEQFSGASLNASRTLLNRWNVVIVNVLNGATSLYKASKEVTDKYLEEHVYNWDEALLQCQQDKINLNKWKAKLEEMDSKGGQVNLNLFGKATQLVEILNVVADGLRADIEMLDAEEKGVSYGG